MLEIDALGERPQDWPELEWPQRPALYDEVAEASFCTGARC